MKLKNTVCWAVSILVGASLNFGIFLFAYKKLAFPYIYEEQRVDNAPYIFEYVLPAMLIATLLTIVVFYTLSKKKT